MKSLSGVLFNLLMLNEKIILIEGYKNGVEEALKLKFAICRCLHVFHDVNKTECG